jgi:hypothetical protein
MKQKYCSPIEILTDAAYHFELGLLIKCDIGPSSIEISHADECATTILSYDFLKTSILSSRKFMPKIENIRYIMISTSSKLKLLIKVV